MGELDNEIGERERIEQALQALETQRATLGDEVVRTSLAALRQNLAALEKAERRSLVTVLFADISAFASMAERLDAEEVQDLLRLFWSDLDQVIVSYGGHIDKHMGDRVMAVWGLTQPREDDPERAIRAALAMQAELTPFGRTHGVKLPMRIGINTGLASIAHIPSTGERNIIGDTVNLASRLEGAAPGRGVLVSQATYNLVRGLFETERQPPLTVKGKAEPVQTYLVAGSRERDFGLQTRGLTGVVTRTIGRETELALLQTAYQDASSGAGMQWITISGEAGVGKSRLLADFEHWVETLPKETHLLKARAWPQTTHSPYHFVRNLMALRCQIGDSDSLDVARERLTAELTEELGKKEGEEAAAFIGQLIGFDLSHSPWIAQVKQDRKRILKRAEELMGRYLGSLAADRPAAMLLEDLQWADEQSLGLLSALFDQQLSWKLVVVGATRLPLWERGLTWGQASHHRRLELQALEGEPAFDLVRELLQKVTQPPTWLIELLVEQGGGNPYFTEELVNWLIEQGMIEAGPDTWQVHLERPWGLSVPGTVQGVLQARVEHLDREASAALQRAAVVGVAFWSGAVDYVGQETVPPERWADLERRGLVFQETTSQIPGQRQYHFKHALLRDVVYEYTLRKQRQLFHERTAQWLAEVAAERSGEWAAVIAAHYEQARVPDLAADWYGRAGDQARGIHALQPAVGYLQRALALLPPPSDDEPEPAERSAKRATLFQGLGEMLRLEARFAEATEAYIGMLAAATAAGDSGSQTLAWNKGFPTLQDASAAMVLGMQGAGFGDPQDDRQLAVIRINLLGALYQLLGCEGPADQYMEGSLALLREPDYRMSDDTEGAISLYEDALAAAQELGNLGGKMLCLTNLGSARLALREYQAAAEDLLQVTSLAEGVEWFGVSEAHRLLAEAWMGEGRVADALESAQQALSHAEAVEQQAFVGKSWRTLGNVAMQSDTPVVVNDTHYDARECFANSVKLLKEAGARAERARTLIVWADYELEQGDRQQGETMRQTAKRIFGQLGIRQAPTRP